MSPTRRILRGLAIVAPAFLIALLAFPSTTVGASRAIAPAAAARIATSDRVVSAVLSDMHVAVDRTTISAGDVTFLAQNQGSITHELVVLKTDLRYDQLPPDLEEAGKIFEDIHMGETGDVDPGAFTGFTVTLPPGNYALVCNEPGHYMAGMRIPFTVTDSEVAVSIAPTSLSLDQQTVIAGTVRFDVTNSSGSTEKFVVLRTGGTQGATASALTTAVAGELSIAGSTADVASGKTAQFSIPLSVGTYVIICYENGQYETDQQATFTVTARPIVVPYTDAGDPEG